MRRVPPIFLAAVVMVTAVVELRAASEPFGLSKIVPPGAQHTEWQKILDFNLTGTFLGVQWAARRMAKLDPGANRAILVVSSIRALGARPGRLAYSATKGALNQLVRVAALELAEHGIRVNALSPGITATPMALERNPEVYAQMTASVPLGRSGAPEDMGAAARYLCSPAARFVTGTNLVVDGGESLA